MKTSPHRMWRRAGAAGLFLSLLAGLLLAPAGVSLADAGSALQFNGTSHHVSLGSSNTVFGGSDWVSSKTISLWLRPDSTPGPATTADKGALVLGPDRPRRFGISRATSGGMDSLWAYNNDSNGFDAVRIAFTPGEWIHIAMVHDGTTLTVYANGERVGETASGPTSLNSPPGDSIVYLGGNGRPQAANYFSGQMDEVRFWSAALSADTIRAWMNRELDSGHPNSASLAAYYRMTFQSPNLLVEDSGQRPAATLLGGLSQASFTASTAPLTGGEPTATFTPLPPR